MKPVIDEGYIKFKIIHVPAPPIPEDELKDILTWRDRLVVAGLLGSYPDGIGFGNISKRHGKGIIISGTQTSHIDKGKPEHFTLVTSSDQASNTVVCEGPVKASSETMTHAIFYKADPNINAVIHIHNKEFWEKYINELPTTPADVAYGTPAMAEAVNEVLNFKETKEKKVIIMGGHEEGLLAFGKDMNEAGQILTSYFPQL